MTGFLSLGSTAGVAGSGKGLGGTGLALGSSLFRPSALFTGSALT